MMLAFAGRNYGEVLVWQRGASASSAIQSTPRGNEFARPFPAKQIAFERTEGDNSEVAWIEMCFSQLLAIDNREFEKITSRMPNIL